MASPQSIVLTSLAAIALCGFAATVHAGLDSPCDCPADIDGSGVIDGLDLGSLLANWSIPVGSPGCGGAVPCTADLNGDTYVDGLDLGILLANWGSCVFDYGPAYPNMEAWQIGLESLGPAGPLTLPQATFDRIAADLAAIRKFEPLLASETHTPAWAPDRILLQLVKGAPTDGYEALNECFDVQSIQTIGFSILLLTFPGPVNVEALSAMYESLPEVQFAEPDGLIGGQNFYEFTPLPGTPDMAWQWSIDDGFHDCFDGCDCHNLYVFRTNMFGDVELISYQFIGAPWCPVLK